MVLIIVNFFEHFLRVFDPDQLDKLVMFFLQLDRLADKLGRLQLVPSQNPKVDSRLFDVLDRAGHSFLQQIFHRTHAFNYPKFACICHSTRFTYEVHFTLDQEFRILVVFLFVLFLEFRKLGPREFAIREHERPESDFSEVSRFLQDFVFFTLAFEEFHDDFVCALQIEPENQFLNRTYSMCPVALFCKIIPIRLSALSNGKISRISKSILLSGN